MTAGEKVIPMPRPKGPFPLLTASELWAPLEEPEYVIEGVVRRASLTQLVAYGSSGKTWLAIDACLSVAAAVPWLGRFEASRGRAAYIDYENGSYELRRRLHGVARARELTPPLDGIEACVMPSAYMTGEGFDKQIAQLARGRDLVVIDTLRAASPGCDENDSSIRVGLDHLRRAAEVTGCAFLVLVHAKKTSGNITAIDAREAGRGSSAIFDAADVVLHATYVKGEPLRIQQTKARLGRPVEPFLVNILDTENGGIEVTAEDWPDEAGDDKQDAAERFEKASETLHDLLQEHPQSSATFLATRGHMRKSTVLAVLEYLERMGAARNIGTVSRPKWVAVTNEGAHHENA